MGWVTGYLLIGASIGGLFYFVIHVAITQDDPDDEMRSAIKEAESAVGSYPGGMAGFLVTTLLAWPLLAMAMFLKYRGK